MIRLIGFRSLRTELVIVSQIHYLMWTEIDMFTQIKHFETAFAMFIQIQYLTWTYVVGYWGALQCAHPAIDAHAHLSVYAHVCVSLTLDQTMSICIS